MRLLYPHQPKVDSSCLSVRLSGRLSAGRHLKMPVMSKTVAYIHFVSNVNTNQVWGILFIHRVKSQATCRSQPNLIGFAAKT